MTLVVLVHGGREFGVDPVGRFDLPVLRMDLFGWSIGRQLRERGVRMIRPRFSQQGWNTDGASAVADLARVVEREAPGPSSVVLVGHSMGGRASMRLADHPNVAGVVGLAPWLPDGEPMGDVAGRTLRVAHGIDDRTTFAADSLDFIERARDAGADARHEMVSGEGHALLRRPGWWNHYIMESIDEILGLSPLRRPNS